ncbi:YkgJ family cysteine cluster protein [Nonomuraea sp. NPDC049637]|uniref:YkgJ family cysteine cluster protein n=1 Tax=Nonomuraea sp. NPDC049637 TaxID=3154356 RepID=UPI003448A568
MPKREKGQSAARRAAALQALRELYATLPEVACKGYCQRSCRSPIDVSDLERQTIHDASGTWIPRPEQWPPGAPCPLLTPAGRCGDHANRPTICRLYGAGATANMQCPHGCLPTARLTLQQTIDVLLQALEIGGHPDYRTGTDRLREIAADQRLRPALLRVMTGDPTALEEIHTALRRLPSP